MKDDLLSPKFAPSLLVEAGDFVESMQGIAAEIGPEAARDLALHFGGTRLFIPKNWHVELSINLIGDEKAKRLCALFGPERLDIPMMPYRVDALKRFVALMRDQDMNANEIARSLHMSYRSVQAYASGKRALTGRRVKALDVRQADLIDWLTGKD